MQKAKKRTSKPAISSPYRTKADRFVGVATIKVNRAISAIRAVGKLSGGRYESTADQRAAIANKLQEELDRAITRLNGNAVPEFTLRLA